MKVSYNGTIASIKHHEDSFNYVTIGATQIVFVVNGTNRRMRDIEKPHADFTLGDMQALLDELDSIPK